ncbi:MAG: hypothetical protein IJZ96_09535 [Lachnospiraceae bacterium]|nr:hypothetical protein [Lachnospiraceae bacterium]MBQ8319209.1 hypothetical protein [Lachnospiraceae bacterium]
MVRPRKYNDHDYSTLIKNDELKTLYPGMKYSIYEDEDGSIHGETLCATFDIAKTREDYEKLSEEKLEDIIYCGEMSIAR